MDHAWALIRMGPAHIFLTGNAVQEMQQVPSWEGFNSMLYPEHPNKSKILYYPMIEGSSRELSTIYTVMKHAQSICSNLEQIDTVITFDLAIYMKAKQIQMKCHTVIRFGGFHIALNYLSLLGKKFQHSGLDDLLIESGVYATSTISAIMKGKSYNRRIRVHKLAMEALFRLMWDAFFTWYKSVHGECKGLVTCQ